MSQTRSQDQKQGAIVETRSDCLFHLSTAFPKTTPRHFAEGLLRLTLIDDRIEEQKCLEAQDA
jgi:hypothetical protein